MAWPESLTASQQQQVQDLTNACRSFMAMLWQLNILGAAIAANWNGGTTTLVQSGLQSGDLIPQTSGLAGAQPLAAADVTNIAGYAINFSNAANASQGTGGYASPFIEALAVKAAGIGNAITVGPISV
jgi:hypothetical protein